MGIFNGSHKDSNSPEITPTAPYGVETLYPCPNADFDICFVHGLTGDRRSTWTADQETSPWPQKLLPSRISRARILTYGYDAYVVQKSAVSQNRLSDHARNLLIDLTTYRASSHTSSRPLIFVAHSMGGLVCKAAMLSSRENPELHLRLLFTHIKGIVFLGTPHRGSWMAQWAKFPATLFGALKPANTSLLDVLETDNQLLGSLQVQFWEMVRGEREAGRCLEVTCFYEERGLRRLNSNPVVSKESATQDGYNFGSIDANHMNMTKFSSLDENGFSRIVGELERWMQSSRYVMQPSLRNP